jgi:peroxiredoxin
MAEPRDPDRSFFGLPTWVAPLTFLALALIGIFMLFGRNQPSSSGAPVVTPGQASSGDIRAGVPAPDFKATAFDGSTIQLSSLRGKVVLLNFFASWCTECRGEFPDIQSAYRARSGQDFTVLGVNTLETGDGKAFFRELGATFPAVSDPAQGGAGGAIAKAYGIGNGLPVTIFINKDGVVHQVFPGRIDRTNIDAELRAMGVG